MIDKIKEEVKPFEVDPEIFQKSKKKTIKGGQGTVTFMIDSRTNKNIVLKQSNKKITNNRIEETAFYQEVHVLATVHHPAIVKFVGWACKGNKGLIFLEQAERGSLDGFIKEYRKTKTDPLWDDTHKLIIAYGVASAMKYLHLINILHRDLKSENVLLDENLFPYVTDFGTSKTKDDVKTSITVRQTTATIMPPEFLENYETNNRNFAIDVYSYAMVLYSIATLELPFEKLSTMKIIEKIKNKERPEFPSGVEIPEPWKKLIEKCWDQEPKNRPTFEEICSTLESPEFVTDSINKELFNEYKEKVNVSPPSHEVAPDYSGMEANNNNQNEEDDELSNLTPIERMKKEAEKGKIDSQLSYALHLYNGIGVPKNKEEAKHYFELAADGGNGEAQFYYSLILAHDGDLEKSATYNQKAFDSQNIEALTNYCQQLIESGEIDKALKYLPSCLINGSITAMILYGNISENNEKYGCSNIYYEMAANCCHCRDELGFYFPIDYKVFKCEKCNVEICEGCAKHCHKGHPLIEIGLKNAFVCDCGKNHFVDNKNKKLCSIAFVGEMLVNGNPSCYQHMFKCNDCNPDLFICKACAENCHGGHNVQDCGLVKAFCACGDKKFKDKCKSSYFISYEPGECSCSKSNYPVLQRWFNCMTCGLYSSDQQGVCYECAKKCHENHALLDRGAKRLKCQCQSTNKCQLKK